MQFTQTKGHVSKYICTKIKAITQLIRKAHFQGVSKLPFSRISGSQFKWDVETGGCIYICMYVQTKNKHKTLKLQNLTSIHGSRKSQRTNSHC